MSRLVAVTIPGPAGALEALLQERDETEPRVVAVVCHPHPVFGGTMHNKVVHRVAATLLVHGVAVARFNFRGVGKSEGQFDQGDGELEDARAVLGFMRQRHPAARAWVAGFSFGSWIAARLATASVDIERPILVAPPVATSDFSALRRSPISKLVVQGTQDPLCPAEATRTEFANWMEPKRLILVEGATHFFDKQLGALSEALLQALVGTSAEASS